MERTSQSVELDFSLVNGGPTYRLMRRARLIRQSRFDAVRKVCFFSLLCWLPLLLLTAAQGQVVGSVEIPFLLDLPAHVRFLLAVPVLLAIESSIDHELAGFAGYFVESGLMSEESLPDFERALDGAVRLRNSTLSEIIIAVLTYANVWFSFKAGLTEGVSTWQIAEPGRGLTPAGWWYVFVSIPVFQFLLFRWFWRMLIWCIFLWRVSRLDLRLVPAHPDQAGGLSFLGTAQSQFIPIFFSGAAVLSAAIAERILFEGARLDDYLLAIVGFIVISIILTFGPLLVFSGKLVKSKRAGILHYWELADEHHRLFDAKWMKARAVGEESVLGCPDVSSLADVNTCVEAVSAMRPVPFDLKTVLWLALFVATPALPLLLTEFSLKDIILKLFSILA